MAIDYPELSKMIFVAGVFRNSVEKWLGEFQDLHEKRNRLLPGTRRVGWVSRNNGLWVTIKVDRLEQLGSLVGFLRHKKKATCDQPNSLHRIPNRKIRIVEPTEHLFEFLINAMNDHKYVPLHSGLMDSLTQLIRGQQC